MASLRDLVSGDDGDEDDENFLLQFMKENAALLRRKRQQRRVRGQEMFVEPAFTNTDALKWEQDALAALEAEYPTLTSALIATAAATNQRRHKQPSLHGSSALLASSAPLTSQICDESVSGVILKEVCVHLVKMWYPRIWIIPAFTIPEVHFVPLCAEVQIQRTALNVQDSRVEALTEALVALRGRSEAYSVHNYDYSEERCVVQVLREAIQPYDDGSDIADRQRVLAWWPEGDRSTLKNTRVAAVLRSIAIERAKRQQWNQHVAEQLAGSGCDAALQTAAAAAVVIAANNATPPPTPSRPGKKGDESEGEDADGEDEASSPLASTMRRHSLATTSTALFPDSATRGRGGGSGGGDSSSRRTPVDRRNGSRDRRRRGVRGTGASSAVSASDEDEAVEVVAGERLYWPALVKRVVGVFEGHPIFEETPRGLGALQSYDDLGEVIATALQCPMRLCMDVVFAVDEVSECRRLDLTPNVIYTPAPYFAFVQPRSETTVAAVREILGVQRRLFPLSSDGAEREKADDGGGGGGGPRSRQRLAAMQVEEDAVSMDGDDEVMAAVRRVYANGNGCTVAEANEWTSRLRHPQDCPVLTPEVLPEVVSIRNMSFTPSAEDTNNNNNTNEHNSASRPCGSLNAASLTNSPISLYDMLAGPTCQTRTLVLLRASTTMLSRAQHEAIKDVVERWRRLRQALIDRLTAYEEAPARPPSRDTDAHPVEETAPPLVQLPEDFETPFIEASAERADALPPEPMAQENMTDAQLREATRVPRLQSHTARTLGSVSPAEALAPSPIKQTRAPSKAPAASTVAVRLHVARPRDSARADTRQDPETMTDTAGKGSDARPGPARSPQTALPQRAPRTSVAPRHEAREDSADDEDVRPPMNGPATLPPSARCDPDIAVGTVPWQAAAPSRRRSPPPTNMGLATPPRVDRTAGPACTQRDVHEDADTADESHDVRDDVARVPPAVRGHAESCTDTCAVVTTPTTSTNASSSSSSSSALWPVARGVFSPPCVTLPSPRRPPLSRTASKEAQSATVPPVPASVMAKLAEAPQQAAAEISAGEAVAHDSADEHEVGLPWEHLPTEPAPVAGPPPPTTTTTTTTTTLGGPGGRVPELTLSGPPTALTTMPVTAVPAPTDAKSGPTKRRKKKDKEKVKGEDKDEDDVPVKKRHPHTRQLSSRASDDHHHHASDDALPEASATVTPSRSARGRRRQRRQGSPSPIAPVSVSLSHPPSSSQQQQQHQQQQQQQQQQPPSQPSRLQRAQGPEQVGRGARRTAAMSSSSAHSSTRTSSSRSPPARDEGHQKAYVLVRRVVRRDPLDPNVFRPLPSLGARSFAGEEEEDDDDDEECHEEGGGGGERGTSAPVVASVRRRGRARSSVARASPLLSLMPPSHVHATATTSIVDGDVAKGGEEGRRRRSEEASHSPSRVRSRTPFHYGHAVSARHSSRTRRRSQLPSGWGTSPLRSVSFRGSGSQSLLTQPAPPADPSVSFDVYSLARAAMLSATGPSGQEAGLSEETEPLPLYRPSALRVHTEGRTAAEGRVRQAQQHAYYIRAEPPAVSVHGTDPRLASPNPSRPLVPPDHAAFYLSTGGYGYGDAPAPATAATGERFARTDTTRQGVSKTARKPGGTQHSTAVDGMAQGHS